MHMARLSHSAALILKALSLGYCFGLDVMEATGLPSGTVYPALRRLERDELVESKWEPEEEATAKQRPAESLLKRAHMTADSCLGNMEFMRGSSEARVPSGGLKSA